MVLVLPFLLVFILLLANVSSFWHAKLTNQVVARSNAWRNAMFQTVGCLDNIESAASAFRVSPQLALSSLFASESARNVSNLSMRALGQACEGNSESFDLITAMKSGEPFGGHKQSLTAQFDQTSMQPHSNTGRSYYLWGSWGYKKASIMFLQDAHVIDINGMRYRQDLPMGHDPYLKKWLIDYRGAATGGRSEAEMEQFETQLEEMREWRSCVEDNGGDFDDEGFVITEQQTAACGEQPEIDF